MGYKAKGRGWTALFLALSLVALNWVSGQTIGYTVQDLPALWQSQPSVMPPAQPAQPVQVQVDGAQTDFASAGIGHRRLAEAAEDRSQHEDRRTDLLGQPVWHLMPAHPAAVHRHVVTLAANAAAQHLQDLHHALHIGDLRHVMQHDLLLRQHAGSQDRQRGILRSVHPQFARKPPAAADNERFHHRPPPFDLLQHMTQRRAECSVGKPLPM